MLRGCSASLIGRLRLSWCQSSLTACKPHTRASLACRRPARASGLASSPLSIAKTDNQDLPSSTLTSLTQLQQQIGQLSHDCTVSPAPPLVFVISGPSGVGKDAVIKQLQLTRPKLHFVVTATSRKVQRPMRPTEVDGTDYMFVTKDKFESWIKEGQLLEHALVYGEYKGILRSQIAHALANKQDVILRLDVQGAATMRRLMPDAVSIFLVATSQHELVHRLLDRKTEPLDKLVLRVQTANNEVAHLHEFDYVVTNGQGQLDQCVRQIDAIIEAEKCKRWRLVN